KFAGEITADPGIRTQDWPVTFRPAARHVRKHRKHRQFIIVIPKNERIVPQKQETKEDDDKSRADGARQSGLALFQMPAMESLRFAAPHRNALQHNGLSFGHHQQLFLNPVFACRFTQTFWRFMKRFETKTESSVMHRNQSFGSEF